MECKSLYTMGNPSRAAVLVLCYLLCVICMNDLFTQKRNDYPLEFELWWECYPKTTGQNKKLAFAKWNKARKSFSAEVIIHNTKRYVANQYAETQEQYMKNPETFLNQQTFDVEISTTESKADGWPPKTPDEWRRVLVNREFWENQWPAQLGVSPWRGFNKNIPKEIYDEYGKEWGWV